MSYVGEETAYYYFIHWLTYGMSKILITIENMKVWEKHHIHAKKDTLSFFSFLLVGQLHIFNNICVTEKNNYANYKPTTIC